MCVLIRQTEIRGSSRGAMTATLGRRLTWRRIASGLFQPLGLKIVDGTIYVTCRDQLVILRDQNGDDETDFYECFNNDHQVTPHFHEFAMGLQRDDAGNFYYAKSSSACVEGCRTTPWNLAANSVRWFANRHSGDRFSSGQRSLPEPRRIVYRDGSGRSLESQEPHQLGS